MSPSPLLQPIKPSEAVAIADLIFRLVQGRGWSNDLRARFASSLPGLGLERLRPFALSLAPDPEHANTFYIACQSQGVEGASNWLLHLSLASAPASTLFVKPTLVARMRPAGEREVIVNAIPLREALPVLIQTLTPHLLARTTGFSSIWSIPAGPQEEDFLRGFPKRSNLLPGIRATQSSWAPYEALLSAGWKDAFVYILEGLTQPPTREQAAPFSRFAYRMEDLADPRAVLNFYRALKEETGRSFDLELDLSAFPALDEDALHLLLDNLKLLGVSLQSVEIHPGLHAGAFATILQSRQLSLTLRADPPDASLPRTHWKLEALP
jgi:hypothetical protein